MIGALIVARFDEQTLRSMADVLQSPVAAQTQAIYNEVKIQQGAFDMPGYPRKVSSVVVQIGASYGATVNEMLSNVGASLGIETGHPPDYRDAAEDIPDAGYIFNDIIDMTYKDEYAAMVEDERVRIESKGLRDFYRVPNGLQDGNVMINP